MNISSKTHGFRVLDAVGGDRTGLRLIEVYPYEGEPPAKRFYIVRVDVDRDQVYSYLPKDNPPPSSGGSQWFAPYTAAGIAYVAKPMTERQARRIWKQIVSEFTSA